METKYHSTRTWLESEFAKRRRKNARYSLRMFARQLAVPSGRLSELVSGRRRMTEKLGVTIANKLLLPPEERSYFLRLARMERTGVEEKVPVYNPLSSDAFHAIADWYHFAILSLIETKDFDPDSKWIGARLNISPVQAAGAMERLARLGLIRAVEGRWQLTHASVATTDDIESVALKLSHRQSLEQAIEKLEEVPIELRDISSVTMAIDMKRLPQAKQMIKKFRRQLCAYLEGGDTKEQVYNINVQLVPVSNLEQKGKKK